MLRILENYKYADLQLGRRLSLLYLRMLVLTRRLMDLTAPDQLYHCQCWYRHPHRGWRPNISAQDSLLPRSLNSSPRLQPCSADTDMLLTHRGTPRLSPPAIELPFPTNRSFAYYDFYQTRSQEESSRQVTRQRLCSPLGIYDYLSASLSQTIPALGSTTTQKVPESGRRIKVHVQSACFNCKKAHLSNDVVRPCNRFVMSGK